MATKGFSMGDRKSFANRVVRRFDKFVQWKLPFPLDPVADVYRKAFTDKEWIAMRYLQEFRADCLKSDSHFNLFWTADETGTTKCPHVTFKLPTKDVSYPKTAVRLHELPEKEERIVRTWITSVNRLRSLRLELRDRCRGVMGNPTGMGDGHITRRRKDLDPCLNNPVQLYKLWPEVQPFMNAEWRNDVMQSSMRTRLPSHVGFQVYRDGRTVWATPEQFRCEDSDATESDRRRFEEINQILLMVSLAADVPEVKDYPMVYGDV